MANQATGSGSTLQQHPQQVAPWVEWIQGQEQEDSGLVRRTCSILVCPLDIKFKFFFHIESVHEDASRSQTQGTASLSLAQTQWE